MGVNMPKVDWKKIELIEYFPDTPSGTEATMQADEYFSNWLEMEAIIVDQFADWVRRRKGADL